MSTKLPMIGFQEMLLLFCGGMISILSLAEKRGGPNVFGVLIGAFIIFGVIFYYQRLRIWARSEGYELIYMGGLTFGRSYYSLPAWASLYRVILVTPEGKEVQALVAFSYFDFTFKKPVHFELNGEKIVDGSRRLFITELILLGGLSLFSLYYIVRGLASWDDVETRVLVNATAIADEFNETYDTPVPLLSRVSYSTHKDFVNLAFSLPSYFPGKNFLVKAELVIHGRGGSRRHVYKGDLVPLWVTAQKPEQSFRVALTESDPEGTTHKNSGKDVFAVGLLGFILSGCGFLYYWRKGAALQSSS